MDRKWFGILLGAVAAGAAAYGTTRYVASKKKSGEKEKPRPAGADKIAEDRHLVSEPCPGCGRPVKEYEQFCPYCGYTPEKNAAGGR